MRQGRLEWVEDLENYDSVRLTNFEQELRVTVRRGDDGAINAAMFERADGKPLLARHLRAALFGEFLMLGAAVFAFLDNPEASTVVWEEGPSNDQPRTAEPFRHPSDEQDRAMDAALRRLRYRGHPRPRRGKAPPDTEVMYALGLLDEELNVRPYGAMKRAADRFGMDISTLHRWRRRFVKEFVPDDPSAWREKLREMT